MGLWRVGLLIVLATAFAARGVAQDAVDSLVVGAGEVRPPVVGAGAPHYSPEQTASAICAALERNATNRQMYELQRAHEATVRARQTRLDFRIGKANEGDLRTTELQRQRAVAPHVINHRRADTLPPSQHQGLAIEDITFQRVLENGRAVLKVEGRVRNVTGGVLPLPPISLYAIDFRDFVLAGQTSRFEPEELAAGQAHDFSLRFRNPPRYTERIHAAFAPPFRERNFRGCAFLDPVRYDPMKLDVEKLHTVYSGDTRRPSSERAPGYTAAELAALGRLVYADAIKAYMDSEVEGAAGRCRPEVHSWRRLMDLTDLIEEAWIATNAAEEVRLDAGRGLFTPEELTEAERARERAVMAVLEGRPPPLKPRSTPRPSIGLEPPEKLPRGEATLLRARVTNNGPAPVYAPALLLTVKDRFGLVLTEKTYPQDIRIEPGKGQQLNVSIPVPLSLVGEATLQLAC